MKFRGIWLSISAAPLLAACGTYQLQPVSMNHPANPQAMSAPEPPLSKTLAYTRSDIPSSQPATASAAQRETGDTPTTSEQQTVTGDGKVIAVVPNASQIVVEHGEIKGFMEPMTMGYRVEPPSLLEGVKVGDKVRFTIDVPKKAIVKIETGAAASRKEGPQTGTADAGSQKTVEGEGKVIATVPSASQIVIEHGEIKGFMEAMTMGYRIDPPSLLEGLKSGDKVRFTIDVPKKAIVKIEKLQ